MCCLIGAVLTTQPWANNADSRSSGVSFAWLGYVLAAISALVKAMSFVAARKTKGASPLWLNMITNLCTVPVFAIMSCVAPDGSVADWVDETWEVLLWVLVLTTTQLMAAYTICQGATWCPPTMGATIFTGTTMAAMYIAGLMFFGQAVDPIAIIGGVFMLAGVCATTLSGAHGHKPVGGKADAQGDAEKGTSAPWESESDSEFFMTGVACVDDSLNNCALTAVGTKGYIGFGGDHQSQHVFT